MRSLNSPIYILLVTDSQACANRISHFLTKASPNFNVLHARSAAEAHLLVSSVECSLFVIDSPLPDADGLDLMCELMAYQPDASAIYLSEFVTSEIRQRVIRLGAAACLETPVDMGLLCALVQREVGPDRQPPIRITLTRISSNPGSM